MTGFEVLAAFVTSDIRPRKTSSLYSLRPQFSMNTCRGLVLANECTHLKLSFAFMAFFMSFRTLVNSEGAATGGVATAE